MGKGIMATSKKEEMDLMDLLKELAQNWVIMVPCILLAGVVGVCWLIRCHVDSACLSSGRLVANRDQE